MVNRATIKGNVRVLRCGVGDETYGIEMSWVQGLRRADEIQHRDEQDGFVGALASPQGDIPVLRLADRLFHARPSNRRVEHIVVLNAEPQPFGVMVDRVSHGQQVPARCLLSVPALAVDPANQCFEGLVKLEQELLLLLSPQWVCPEAYAQPVGQRARKLIAPALSAPQGSRAREENRILVCSLAEPDPSERPLSFALNLAMVHEVLELPKLVPVPRAPAYVLGLTSWRDWAIPVIDLAQRLGLPRVLLDKRSRLLLVRAPRQAELFGFVVRPGIKILRLPLTHQPCRRTLPVDPALTRGAVELMNQTLVIPDVTRLSSPGLVL